MGVNIKAGSKVATECILECIDSIHVFMLHMLNCQYCQQILERILNCITILSKVIEAMSKNKRNILNNMRIIFIQNIVFTLQKFLMK